MRELQGVLRKNFLQQRQDLGDRKAAIKTEIMNTERRISALTQPNKKDMIEIGRGQGTLAKGFHKAQNDNHVQAGSGMMQNKLQGYLSHLRREFATLSANESRFTRPFVYSPAP